MSQLDRPERRLTNPLGELSSYTYQLSLYMITADAYDAFVASGRTRINALSELDGFEASGGAFLVAQSGGINDTGVDANNRPLDSARAPGFDTDFYIENLSYKTFTSGQSTLTASNNAEFKFDIVEPYGFSFITKLKRAADVLAQYNTALKTPKNPIRQFFVLGIRFFGYDENGKLERPEGIFETYYDIAIKSLKFKLDGKETTYNITAASLPPNQSFGLRRGRITNSKEIQATTVGTAIKELFNKLNVEQEERIKDRIIEHKNIYQVKFLGEDAREIELASLLNPADIDKYRWGGSGTQTTDQSNPAVEVRVQPNPTLSSLTFNADTPIQTAINDIISQSSYLRDALKVIYETAAEPSDTGSAPEKPSSASKIKWYNLSTELSKPKWDQKVNDWAYTITYIIQVYETPVIDTPYAATGGRYYGPHKRYEYYFTGENKEVLSYDQKFDNTYFNVALDPSQRPLQDRVSPNSHPEDIPYGVQMHTGGPKLYVRGPGNEAQNTYTTSLYDPGAYAKAKLTILGDPDFLMRETPDSLNQPYNRFYGTNQFTINPNGGQVFVEVDFKEAVDYTSETGTLKINESILFLPYPPDIAKIVKGVSYRLTEVESKFSKGHFTQELTLIINSFSDSKTQEGENGRENQAGEEETEFDGGTISDLINPPIAFPRGESPET